MSRTLEFTNHVCRACFGAILKDGDGYVCAICRVESRGHVESICGCGTSVKTTAGRERPAGFRCVANPSPTPINPSAYVIGFGGDAPAPSASQGGA